MIFGTISPAVRRDCIAGILAHCIAVVAALASTVAHAQQLDFGISRAAAQQILTRFGAGTLEPDAGSTLAGAYKLDSVGKSLLPGFVRDRSFVKETSLVLYFENDRMYRRRWSMVGATPKISGYGPWQALVASTDPSAIIFVDEALPTPTLDPDINTNGSVECEGFEELISVFKDGKSASELAYSSEIKAMMQAICSKRPLKKILAKHSSWSGGVTRFLEFVAVPRRLLPSETMYLPNLWAITVVEEQTSAPRMISELNKLHRLPR